MTRLSAANVAPDLVGGDCIVTEIDDMPMTGRVVVDVRLFSEPAEVIIGQVSYRISLGSGPAAVVFATEHPQQFEPYRMYLS